MDKLGCKSQRAARIAVDRIAAARNSKHIERDAPLYAAMLTWAWWGTGHLNATDSWPKYRSTMSRILKVTGEIAMEDTNRDWYSRVHQEGLDRGWTASNLEAVATRCVGSRDRWDGPRPGGSGLQQTHTAFRAEARAQGPGSPLTKHTDCPTIEDAEAFGEVLGEFAVDRWGPEYECWRHAPASSSSPANGSWKCP